jgi:bis(5'-nucleosyl)-tetraphosphatase (symmetrical)
MCDFSGSPEQAPENCRPWFEFWPPLEHGITLVCGHWAALGLHLGPGLVVLDSGCVWGGALTAIRLEDMQIIQQPTVERADDLP